MKKILLFSALALISSSALSFDLTKVISEALDRMTEEVKEKETTTVARIKARSVHNDGLCPVIGRKRLGSVWLKIYPDPEDDNDCPPKQPN